jgi:alkylation response protein AidB-like acyl-CoA dehydrogenase
MSWDEVGFRIPRQVVLTHCRLPKSSLLRKEGMGFLVTMKTFNQSQPGVASQAVAYAQERKQFDKPISSFQGV